MAQQLAFAFFSAISIILVILPSPWHWKSRNIGTLLYIGWVLLANLVYLVNSIVWWSSAENVAPVWCDISVKFQVGFGTGLLAASLCINRKLAMIATCKSPMASRNTARNQAIIDLVVGIVLPSIIMASSFVVQPHRFDIAEGVGCYIQSYPVLATIFLVQIWPVLLSAISSIYGIIAITAFLRRRLQFASFLKGGQSGLTLNRFLRLSALATIDLLISLPLALYYLIPFSRNLVPWTSFNDIHFDFSTVNSYDANFITRHPQIAAQLLLSRWLAPITAIVFFSFFGLGEDALRDYLALYARLKKMVMGGSRSFPHTQARDCNDGWPNLGTQAFAERNSSNLELDDLDGSCGTGRNADAKKLKIRVQQEIV